MPTGLLVRIVLLSGTALFASCVARAVDYYVSPLGNDVNPGTRSRPWKTTEKVNGLSFSPGDRILFEGGEEFAGGLAFDSGDRGRADAPILVSSYGSARAKIVAGEDECGLYAHNTAGIAIANIDFLGSGRQTNTKSGIFFYCDRGGGVKLSRVHIDRVDVSGFGKDGVTIGAWHESLSGFAGVRVTNARLHHNGTGGMSVWGYFGETMSGWSHRDVYVAHCRFHDNPGDPKKTNGHSGSGVVLGGVEGGVIEYCEAFRNGALCDHRGGGPVGIWAWDSNGIVIQHNESHHNRTGDRSLDGGGFDLDGGAVNSLVQYNYSHDNDGAGFLICQFSGSRRMFGNVVRYNVSENDGRKHGYGGIHFYNAGGLTDTVVHNNTIFMSPAPKGRPAAFKVSNGVENCRAFNNILVTTGGLPVVECGAKDPGIEFCGNAYWSSGAPFRISWAGSEYASLEAWREATGQETVRGRPAGLCADPRLAAPGSGGTVGAYKLRSGSPLVDRGLDLGKLFRIDPGKVDFYGNRIPGGAGFDVGAHEYAP